MKVLGYDAYCTQEEGITYVTTDEIFEKSDIISMHCPLTEETRHMINAESIDRMKKDLQVLKRNVRDGE